MDEFKIWDRVWVLSDDLDMPELGTIRKKIDEFNFLIKLESGHFTEAICSEMFSFPDEREEMIDQLGKWGFTESQQREVWDQTREDIRNEREEVK